MPIAAVSGGVDRSVLRVDLSTLDSELNMKTLMEIHKILETERSRTLLKNAFFELKKIPRDSEVKEGLLNVL